MPNRFALTASPAAVGRHFALRALEPFPPRGKIRPAEPVLVVRGGEPFERERGAERVAFLARWGLIPGWSREPANLPLLFAARAETLGERAAFRGAFRHRRCLLPATGVFVRAPGAALPGRFLRSRDDAPLALAAIWEPYMAPDGSEIDTVALVTLAPAQAQGGAADRLPVVIPPDGFERWLDCRANGPATVADLLRAPDPALFGPAPAGAGSNETREPPAAPKR